MFLLVFIFEFSLVSFRFLILCFMKNWHSLFTLEFRFFSASDDCSSIAKWDTLSTYVSYHNNSVGFVKILGKQRKSQSN
jgi:hypothetical protein